MSEPLTYPLLPPGEKVMLVEMVFVCNEEADRIEGVEASRAKIGDKPIPERVRRAEVLRATANFLAMMIEPNIDEIRAMIARKRGAGRRR